MKIFFTASVKGGRSMQPEYTTIVETLKKYGSVFSEHVAGDELSEYGEVDLSAARIHEREMLALQQSDVVVAEVTTTSLGVGYFLACASMMGKRVIALYNREDALRLSAIIRGDAKISVRTYDDASDIASIFEKEFAVIN
jgi:hypothetical protein